MSTTADPRPLPDEPLSVDLLNTRWLGYPGREGLLTDLQGLALWLDANGLLDRARADEATRVALLQARDALSRSVDGNVNVNVNVSGNGNGNVSGNGNGNGTSELDAVLRHGRIRRAAGPGGPVDTVEVDDTAWLPAWLAVDDYLSLLAQGPERIRRCAHEACVLHFFDVSQNGRRRWCSMARCGNRAKASRHYAQQKNEKGQEQQQRALSE